MDTSLAALRAELSEARAEVGAGWTFGFATDLRAQYTGQLNQAEKMIQRLDTDLRASVEAGTWPAASWLDVAKQQAVLIAYTMGAQADAPNLAAFWAQVVVPTAGQVADNVKPYIPAPGDFTLWLVVGVVGLVALAVLRVKG